MLLFSQTLKHTNGVIYCLFLNAMLGDVSLYTTAVSYINGQSRSVREGREEGGGGGGGWSRRSTNCPTRDLPICRHIEKVSP